MVETDVVASRSTYVEWVSAEDQPHHGYVVPAMLRALGPPSGRRLLDLGCGNGAITAKLAAAGFAASGVDFEQHGIEIASMALPGIDFRVHDLAQPLPPELSGRFDLVVTAEVIEHLFLPRELFARAREAIGDRSGRLVVTTPYHGYVKNLVIALFGRCDHHASPLADFGHIKFFSKKTLAEMGRQCGFHSTRFTLAGRVPPLSASMVMTAERRPLVEQGVSPGRHRR